MIFEQLGNNNVVNNALINQKNEKTGKKNHYFLQKFRAISDQFNDTESFNKHLTALTTQ